VICSKVDEEIKQDVENRNKTINSFPSTDRCTDRKSKSGAEAVHKNVHQSEAK